MCADASNLHAGTSWEGHGERGGHSSLGTSHTPGSPEDVAHGKSSMCSWVLLAMDVSGTRLGPSVSQNSFGTCLWSLFLTACLFQNNPAQSGLDSFPWQRSGRCCWELAHSLCRGRMRQEGTGDLSPLVISRSPFPVSSLPSGNPSPIRPTNVASQRQVISKDRNL